MAPYRQDGRSPKGVGWRREGDVKIYISADIEGVTCIADWDEARKELADYEEFRLRMTRRGQSASAKRMVAAIMR